MGRHASNQQVAFYLDLAAYMAAKDVLKGSNDIGVYLNPAKGVIYIREAKAKQRKPKSTIYRIRESGSFPLWETR